MKYIIFIRPAPYEDLLPGKDLITSFELTGLGIEEPKPDKYAQEVLFSVQKIKQKYNPVAIYTSPAERTKQTARLFGNSFEEHESLKEIVFSLKESVQAEFLDSSKEIDLNALRKELIHSFVKERTKEKPDKVLQRIELFSRKLLTSTDNTILCISHAFVLKCFEIFYRNNCRLEKVSLFETGWDWSQKPYDFLEGFIVSVENGVIVTVSPFRSNTL